MSEYDNHSIPERLQYWTNKHPDAEAFIFIDRAGIRSVLTWQEIFDQAVDFARHLRMIGLKSGDIICSMLPDSPNGIIAFFGILTAGCVLQNGTLNLSDGSFVINNLNKSKCRALILSSDEDDERRRLFSPHFDFHGGHEVSSATLPHVTKIIFEQDDRLLGFKWSREIEDRCPLANDEGIWDDQDSDAFIILTSGTTGMAKMVIHSHKSALLLGKDLQWLMNYKSKIGALNYHSFSWAAGNPSAYLLSTGLHRILIDQRNPPSLAEFYDFLNKIFENEKFDVIFSSVSNLINLVEYVKSHPTSKKWTLPIGLALGSPLSKKAIEVIKPFFETLYNAYGSTETNLVSGKEITSLEDFENFNVGKPGIDTLVKIVDEENSIVPQGETGRIKVKTIDIFKRYLGNEELTKSVFDEDGYFNMGDVGYINKRGEIVCYGRTKEVIMKGENYYHPAWIETVIRSCSMVHDVLVVKVPDDIFLNEICACIVLVPGSKTNVKTLVEEVCRSKFVEDDFEHKSACPKYFIIMDKIPVNANGKPDRKVVEKYAISYLNLKLISQVDTNAKLQETSNN